jgi:O-antigen ligase
MMEWLFLISTLVIVGGFCFLGYNNKYIDYRPDFNKTIFHTDFAQHMTATYRFRDLSTAERFYRWIAAIRLSDDHQLTGVGPNNFYNSYKPYAVSAYKTWVSNNKDHSTVHNYFLLLLCEQGIPGLLIFIALLFAGFYYAQKIYHNATDPVFKTTAITLGAILGIITTVNFLSDLIETDKIGSLFFIGLGMLVWMDCRVKKTVIHHPEGVAAS